MGVVVEWLFFGLAGAAVGAFMTGWIVGMLAVVQSLVDPVRRADDVGLSQMEAYYKHSVEFWSSPKHAKVRELPLFIWKCAGSSLALSAAAVGASILRQMIG